MALLRSLSSDASQRIQHFNFPTLSARFSRKTLNPINIGKFVNIYCTSMPLNAAPRSVTMVSEPSTVPTTGPRLAPNLDVPGSMTIMNRSFALVGVLRTQKRHHKRNLELVRTFSSAAVRPLQAEYVGQYILVYILIIANVASRDVVPLSPTASLQLTCRPRAGYFRRSEHTGRSMQVLKMTQY